MNYDFPAQFRRHYEAARARYAAGARSAAELFDDTDLAWLQANGLNAQTFFDYVEDEAGEGEPGYDQALAIEVVRRDYFLNVQDGQVSSRVLDESSMPRKHDEVAGISWLPRLLPKARAKLRGELPPELMYCCGGDRHFFKTHDILPAEFLALVWRHLDDDAAIVDWVSRRSAVTH